MAESYHHSLALAELFPEMPQTDKVCGIPLHIGRACDARFE